MTSGGRWWPWLVAALICLVVFLVGAVLSIHAWYEQSPPAGPDRPGAVRLFEPDHAGVPPPEERVTLSGDRVVLLALSDIEGSGSGARATLSVVLPHASQSRFVTLGAGRSTTMQGVVLRVVAIYQEPDQSHDAVDVEVTSSS